MAIYSKYPQINKKTVNIDGASMNNSCIYSDIIVKYDTIRVYNIHLHQILQKKDLDYIISLKRKVKWNVGIGKKTKILLKGEQRSVR